LRRFPDRLLHQRQPVRWRMNRGLREQQLQDLQTFGRNPQARVIAKVMTVARLLFCSFPSGWASRGQDCHAGSKAAAFSLGFGKKTQNHQRVVKFIRGMGFRQASMRTLSMASGSGGRCRQRFAVMKRRCCTARVLRSSAGASSKKHRPGVQYFQASGKAGRSLAMTVIVPRSMPVNKRSSRRCPSDHSNSRIRSD